MVRPKNPKCQGMATISTLFCMGGLPQVKGATRFVAIMRWADLQAVLRRGDAVISLLDDVEESSCASSRLPPLFAGE